MGGPSAISMHHTETEIQVHINESPEQITQAQESIQSFRSCLRIPKLHYRNSLDRHYRKSKPMNYIIFQFYGCEQKVCINICVIKHIITCSYKYSELRRSIRHYAHIHLQKITVRYKSCSYSYTKLSWYVGFPTHTTIQMHTDRKMSRHHPYNYRGE